MISVIQFERLQDRIVQIRGQSVLLDADVAELYGVATRDIKLNTRNAVLCPPSRSGHLVGMMHVELLLIHAFRDGNGRLARWLVALMAVHAGYPIKPKRFGFFGLDPSLLLSVSGGSQTRHSRNQ